MVRYYRPRLVIEVGSGFSSLVLGQAAAKEQDLKAHLYRAISAQVSSRGISRLAVIDREEGARHRIGILLATRIG